MEKIISCRLEKKDAEFLGEYSREVNATKGMVLRELVEEGRRMLALSLYKQGKASFGKAAKVAGITVSEFLDLLKEFGVNANVTVQDFKESLLYAKKISIVK